MTDQALGQERYTSAAMATPSVREMRGADTRRRIIRGAWNVIAERGLAGMTTRLVAEEAGISHGMCHYHFDTRDELVLAVVDHVRQYWIDPMEILVAAPGTARDRLNAVVRWMAEPATREVMRVHLELMSQCEYSEPLRERMAAEYARWQGAYVELFLQLAGEDALRAGLDAERIGVAFATLADGLVDQRSLNPSLDTAAIMRAFLDPLLMDT
jgi:AcrR family transcriptional regulator